MRGARAAVRAFAHRLGPAGWGDQIEWRTFDEAKVETAKGDKLVMLVIHKSWCGACKALKPQFAASEEIAKAAGGFIMVNTEDDEEPKQPDGNTYGPDGGYIPRIMFLNKDMEVVTGLYNEAGSDKYKYYYSSPTDIEAGMKRALAHTQ